MYIHRNEKKVVIRDDAEHANEDSDKAMIRSLRKDMADKNARFEDVLAERNQLLNRVKVLEDRSHDGHHQQLENVSRLTGKVEQLETELKIVDERAHAANQLLETQVILCKDREKQLHQLQEEVW